MFFYWIFILFLLNRMMPVAAAGSVMLTGDAVWHDAPSNNPGLDVSEQTMTFESVYNKSSEEKFEYILRSSDNRNQLSDSIDQQNINEEDSNTEYASRYGFGISSVGFEFFFRNEQKLAPKSVLGHNYGTEGMGSDSLSSRIVLGQVIS